jgi:hypothetical protein
MGGWGVELGGKMRLGVRLGEAVGEGEVVIVGEGVAVVDGAVATAVWVKSGVKVGGIGTGVSSTSRNVHANTAPRNMIPAHTIRQDPVLFKIVSPIPCTV